MKTWKRIVQAAAAACVAGSVAAAQPPAAPSAALRVLVNPGDSSEQSRVAAYLAWKGVLEQALRRQAAGGVNIALSMDATADLGATRARTHDMFIAPAHVVGSAVRYGYHPVLGLDKPVQAVLVAPKDSAIASLADAKGRRLGLPLQDSVVTYLMRGEVNAANTTLKRHFASVYDTRYQEALLPCLQLCRCDVVAVEKAVYERWVAAGEPVKAVMESRPVPGLSLAIRDGGKVAGDALHGVLADSGAFAALLRAEKATAAAHKPDDFKYKDAALVFACNGPECWKSFKASHAALKAGYRKVYWFRGGFPEWRASGMKFDFAAAQ